MTKEEAIFMSESGWWKDKSPDEIVSFQLYEEKICMPFSDFHEAMEKAFGRSIWTHEFADQKGLQAEYEGRREPEFNPLESAARIFKILDRKDLIDNTIIIQVDEGGE